MRVALGPDRLSHLQRSQISWSDRINVSADCSGDQTQSSGSWLLTENNIAVYAF